MQKHFSGTALFMLIVFAALFETVREHLYRLGQGVGGVGGIGGLTNQYAPHHWCNHTAAYTKLYCYHPGVLGGLTPFAIVTTLFWLSPLIIVAIGSIVESWDTSSSSEPTTPTTKDRAADGDTTTESKLVFFKFGWAVLSAIWFINPLCAYLASPFYQVSAARAVLGVSLSASYPLSWSLMLVALPMAEGSCASRILGLKNKAELVGAHYYMAKWCGLWVFLHAIGELIYLGSTKTLLGALNGSLAYLSGLGENLLYVFGIITLGVAVVHGTIAVFRKHWYPVFRALHLPTALLLLIVATVHWWGFAFFMLPAAAAHGHHFAKKKFFSNEKSGLLSSLALLVAICCALVTLGLVWYGRQVYMERADANAYIPFVFAGASIALSFLSAFAAAIAVFVLGRVYARKTRGCGTNNLQAEEAVHWIS